MTKRPVILHITKWFPHEQDPQLGVFVEKHVRSVMNECDVHVLHIQGDNIATAEIKQIEHEGLSITRLTFPSEKSTLHKLCTFQQQVKNAVKAIPDPFHSPDLIHAHILAQPSWIARKFFPNVPVVLTEHWTGFINGYFEKLPLWKRSMFKLATSRSEVVTVPSEALKTAMMQNHKFKGNFKIVPNVIDSLEGISTPDAGAPLVLTVADLHDHNKNISGSLRTLAKFDLDFRFEIVGDGEDKDKLENLARELGLLEKKVSFLGRMDNLAVLKKLKSASFLLINSRFETFSMIAAEALLTGVPVLTTRCGGPEAFVNESNGIVVNTEDEIELKNALEYMFLEYGNFDRQKIVDAMGNKFSKTAVGAQFTSLYQEILS